MKRFSDFKIKTRAAGFTGDSIKITRILNKEITVIDYKIEPSNFNGNRLTLQIEMNGTKHIIWTGSAYLLAAIEQIPKPEFPFKTTIIEEDEKYLFS